LPSGGEQDRLASTRDRKFRTCNFAHSFIRLNISLSDYPWVPVVPTSFQGMECTTRTLPVAIQHCRRLVLLFHEETPSQRGVISASVCARAVAVTSTSRMRKLINRNDHGKERDIVFFKMMQLKRAEIVSLLPYTLGSRYRSSAAQTGPAGSAQLYLDQHEKRRKT
jgi:hypothetical protein